MKKTKFFYGALALLAGAAMTACSSDEPITSDLPDVIQNDETRYLHVAICAPGSNGSRDFQDGSVAESAVSSLIFVFYDGAGVPTATMKSYNSTEIADGWTEDYNNDNVTRFWTSVIPVEMTQGQNKPAYVMCFVNPVDQTGLSTMTLNELAVQKRTTIINGEGNFAMSNSVYYGNNPISGQENVRMMATPILNAQLFKTQGEAQTAADASDPRIVNIYVERYAAKIGLTLAPTAIQPYAVKIAGTNANANLVFTPEYWRPNAIDQSTFVAKAFSTGESGKDWTPTDVATYTQMEEAFKNTGMALTLPTKWNDPANYRSYWSCSPAYFANRFPRCSDDITDNADWQTTFPYELKYYTYNEVSNQTGVEAAIAWNTTDGFTVTAGDQTTAASGYFYAREATSAIDAIRSADNNNRAVIASAVIVGNYRLANAEDAPTFYLYGTSEGKPVYYTDANIETALIANNGVLFTDQNGTTPATDADLFVVQHPAKSVRTYNGATDPVPGRLVTLQLAAVPEQAVYFYNGTGYVAVDATNIDHANWLLWKSVSTAQKFWNGHAFFSIPIRHLGFNINVTGEALFEGTNANTNSYNWANMRRGDFGVVRNHVYTLNVNKIEGLGTGLENLNQPIVPPMDPDNYYIAARLNILSWRVVPAQGVDL